MSMNVQFIGADLGRGYVKGYTLYEGKEKDCLFKSVIGEGRKDVEYKDYDQPIHLIVDDTDYFIGELAEKESFNSIPNFSDDKTTQTAEILLYALLNELAEAEFVKIALGVPNKAFSKEMYDNVIEKYKGKQVQIIDEVNNTIKKVVVADITIFRESDSALMHVVDNHTDRKQLPFHRLGMVTVGFRTTELTFFDKSLKYNNKFSKSYELGHKTVLEIIQKNLEKGGISKSLHEIDEDTEYKKHKEKLYNQLVERINQEIEMKWINHKEMRIFLGGGTVKEFAHTPKKFEVVEDPQMITAKGLYLVSKGKLNG